MRFFIVFSHGENKPEEEIADSSKWSTPTSIAKCNGDNDWIDTTKQKTHTVTHPSTHSNTVYFISNSVRYSVGRSRIYKAKLEIGEAMTTSVLTSSGVRNDV